MNKKLFIIPLLVLLFSCIASATDLTTDIVSYYKFDETTGTTATDSAGSSSGSISGATINQPGKIDKSYSFDGNNDYININNASLRTTSISYSIWIKKDAIGTATMFPFSMPYTDSATWNAPFTAYTLQIVGTN